MGVLIIDDKNVELGSTRLVFSKYAYSFTDWVTKDIPYSERVTLPGTSTLNSIFSRPFSPEIRGDKFSKFHKYKYLDNGKIASSGIAKLLAFNDSREYEIQLIDSSFELFENLEGTLSNLELEDSDFVFNLTSYNNLKLLNSSVWIWAASSMHQDKVLSKNILSGNLAFSRPYFSVKNLLETIFEANGWDLELSSNIDLFNELIISAKSEFVFTSYEKEFNTSLSSGAVSLSGYSFLNTDTITSSTTLNINRDSKIRLRGKANAYNDFTMSIIATGSDPQYQIIILNKGEFDYDITSNEFKAGSAITISLSGSGSVDLSSFLIYTIIDENDFGAMSSANFAGFKVKTYDNLPEITQKDLFKHALVSVGGFFNSSNFRKKLTIYSIVNISKLGAIDWSSKFVEDSENVTPLEGYGRINYYTYDNSEANPLNLGRGAFVVNNETLPDVANVYESIFAASQEVLITNNMIDNFVYDDSERVNELNTLLGHYGVSGSYSVARFENLNGNNILSNFYTNFVAGIKGGEVIEAYFNLNKSDFFLFDFTSPIFVKQKKAIFYVLGIADYSETELTKVTLLKM